ncbi:metallo-beta-lactamase domain protein [Halobacteriovorax sp. BALOs_7]|uniref:MBL fold metallo-hydrolase n=1 Tax=Halobacteriovorax sp. BALOs_7 TaxID=2109558 RepID=UPI000EA28555|nr:MBL fold metallo-hydrolase [Halobacteriovorax sp. BALOs_7]AYF45743.1 metallo-beta-lactamase domain protein [Halobacteriovorax sp. BALOs_7]
MDFKIHQLKGYIQTIYLVEEKGSFLLLDGCCRPDVEVVESYLESKLNRNLSDIKLVITTHAHPDHMGGVELFKKRGIPIAGPRDLNQMYSGPFGIVTYWVDILLTYLVALNKKRGFKNILFSRKVKLDYILTDLMEVPFFKNWKVLECPGHTIMDLSIFHEEQKLAYIADNFVSTKTNVFRPYPIWKPQEYRSSLQRYIDLGINDFLIAHYGQVKVSHERIKELIDSTPDIPRKHHNSLPAILMKLLKSVFK